MPAVSVFKVLGIFLSLTSLAVIGGCQRGGTSQPQQPVAAQPLVTVRPHPRGDTLELAPTTLPVVVPKFENVAAQLGIDFTFFNDAVPERFFLPEVMGGGAGWIDFDRDGRLDLLLVNGSELRRDEPPSANHPNGLWQNRGGSFHRVESAGGLLQPGFGQGCAVGDFDCDGFPDVYIAYYGPDRLFHNQGDGSFVDVTIQAGIRDELWGSSVVWLDLDDDLDLDLYVVNYMDVTFANYRVCQYNDKPGYCGPGDYEGVPDQVYLSQGDGTFVEAAAELGLVAPDGKGLAVVAADFDNDARPEIYVANDMTANFMFRRTDTRSANKMYDEVAEENGCAVSEAGLNEASMGVAVSDFDGDGRIDIFLTHFFGQKNTLYRNLGRLLFVDDSRKSRVAATSFHTLGFGTCSFDYDRDGAADLFVANGHVLGKHHFPNEMEPQLLRNDGRGRFDDISKFAGPYFQDKWLGRSAAGGDYDNDGDLDLVVSHLDRPVAVLRNDTVVPHHFIGLDLRTEHRITPVGGRVVVKSGEREQSLPISAGGSYLSSHDPRLLCGIHPTQVDIDVYWPSGHVDHFTNLQADRYWLIVEAADSSVTRVSVVGVP